MWASPPLQRDLRVAAPGTRYARAPFSAAQLHQRNRGRLDVGGAPHECQHRWRRLSIKPLRNHDAHWLVDWSLILLSCHSVLPISCPGDQQTQQSQVGHDEHPPVVPFRSAVELRVSGDPDCTTDAKRPNEGKSLYDNDLPVGVPTEVALLCRSMTLLT